MSHLLTLARGLKGKTPEYGRLLNSKLVDIIHSLDNAVLMEAVPKQMLTHFCGWKHISDMFCFFQGKQVLKLKRKECEQRGVRIVVAWMQRALRRKGNVDMIKAPLDNIIDACMIERALWALRCYSDANRVNRFIEKHYFSRALSYQQGIDLWTTFPHNCIHNRWLAENFYRTLWATWDTYPGFTAKHEARWVLDEHPQLAQMIEEAASKAGHNVHSLLCPSGAKQMDDAGEVIPENDVDDYEFVEKDATFNDLGDDYEIVEQNESFKNLGDEDWEIVGSYEDFAADIAQVLDEMEISVSTEKPARDS